MNSSGDAAEQVVRLSLEGFEVVAKVSGEAAKSIAVLLISALKQEQKTKGRARLTNMIKSGKELKVYTVQQKDLKEFTKHAKKYGVLYTVLRDKNNKDKNAFVDIIARADDASKIQRIIDRFDLATVDKGTIVSQSEKAIEERKKKAEEKTDKSENNELFDEIFAEDNSEKSADKSEHKPFIPQTEKSPPSENGSIGESTLSNEGTVVKDKKPSVREKLNEYRRQIKQQKEQNKQTPVVDEKPKADKKPAVTEHQQPKPIKNKKPKER